MPRPTAPTLLPAATGGAVALGTAVAVLGFAVTPVALAAGAVAALVGAAATFGLRREPGPPRLVLPAVPTSDELLDAVNQVEAQIKGKVPPPVAARVARICATIRDTIPRLDQLGAGSAQAHSVVATATSYLPEAVGGYLRLPRSWADKRPVSGGKTSLMVLCDQLDLLAHRMDQVFDAVCQADADALVAHGAFLRDKFGAGALDLGGLPPPSSAPGGDRG